MDVAFLLIYGPNIWKDDDKKKKKIEEIYKSVSLEVSRLMGAKLDDFDLYPLPIPRRSKKTSSELNKRRSVLDLGWILFQTRE